MSDDNVYHYSKHPLISCSRMHREAIDKIARRGFTPEEQKAYNARQTKEARAQAAAKLQQEKEAAWELLQKEDRKPAEGYRTGAVKVRA